MGLMMGILCFSQAPFADGHPGIQGKAAGRREGWGPTPQEEESQSTYCALHIPCVVVRGSPRGVILYPTLQPRTAYLKANDLVCISHDFATLRRQTCMHEER